jgi:hypothetical protein
VSHISASDNDDIGVCLCIVHGGPVRRRLGRGLGVRVKPGKDGSLGLTYRPPLLLCGPMVSGSSFAVCVWCLLMVGLRREP